MSEYACGHDGKPIVMSGDALSIAAWLEWKDSVGFDGDKSMCFTCWCAAERKVNK